MSEDIAVLERRAASWWRGQLSFPNLVAAAGIVIGLTAAKAAVDTKNEVQDLKITALEERLKVAEGVFYRRDNADLRLSNIEQQLDKLDKKLDTIGRAVK